MKVKYIGYAKVEQQWYPLMSGEGLIAYIEDQDPFDYIAETFNKARIEYYLVTYVILES